MSTTIIGINNEENRVIAKRPLKEVLEQIETTEGMELHTALEVYGTNMQEAIDDSDNEYVVKVGSTEPQYFNLSLVQDSEELEVCVDGAIVYDANCAYVCSGFILELLGCEETITEHDEGFYSLMGFDEKTEMRMRAIDESYLAVMEGFEERITERERALQKNLDSSGEHSPVI